MPRCNQLQENTVAIISSDYQMKPLTYRTKDDKHFQVYVVSKSEAEFQQHMENFRRAGLEPVAGQEVVAVKVEKSEPAPLSFAQILKSER